MITAAKKHIAITLFVGVFLMNCTQNESVKNGNAREDMIWQDGDKSITNVLDSIPKVVIKGFTRESEYHLTNSVKNETENEIVLNGKISVFGDLNSDGIPEFYHEDITETTDTLFGKTNLLGITPDQKIFVISSTSTAIDKKNCQQPVGFEEFFTIDSTNVETPFVVLNGKYGYLNRAGDCNSFVQATSRIYFNLQPNQSYLTQISNCPINDPEIELDILYEQNNYELRALQNLHHNYYSLYDYYSKFRACGDDGKNGLSHLEAIAYTTAKNGNNAKRDDLMPFIEDEFTNINPTFITWVKDNLIPEPTDRQANGLAYSFMYQYGYKQQFRKFALLRLLIMQQGQEQLMKEYANATSTIEYIEEEERTVRKENYNTYGFLESKHQWAMQEFSNSGYETKYLENTDYGFLMRRMLDGSEPAIWNTIEKVLKLYDNDWYQETFINTSYEAILPIDSITYFNQRMQSGADSIILSKEAIPEGIVVENGAGITITCKNGKEVTFTNNNSDGESYENYALKGYWPSEEMILIRAMGWEVGSILLVDLKTGKNEYRNWEIYPSKDGQYMAESIDEMGYQAILLLKKEESKWVKMNEYANQYIKDGFWLDGKFYFEGDNTYYTFGDLIL